jgi:lipoate-protein ligase A
LFDVERFREEPRRVVTLREVAQPTLVLGSTQPTELVAGWELRRRGVEMARRRGGGGAVFLRPGEYLWIDAWIPRGDPLWMPDVGLAAEWVGAWWMSALAGFGLEALAIHTGRSVPGEFGELVCFAGHGPGEVLHLGRKVVGLSQWRSREGALFSSCAYHRWDPASLLDLIAVDDLQRTAMVVDLASVAVGLGELDPAVEDIGRLWDRLVGSFPDWEWPPRSASDGPTT